ncbi:MAG: UDP-4-amino-4,6-dideoxy-N-acetyl-beta-L-altrosamine transaminase [Candidatus Electrothrix sp. AR4]|nr:UDP-4-amino-4,6-dideoxy-N-acetyl-beta-L-altrosamine transaminase [Candidatus Electrothrix sp. AR4]
MIPYGRQQISEEDIQAVVEILRSDWLTQGPMVKRFERAVADYCEARYAVAVSSGTAALHLAALAAKFGPSDEIITSPITFVASANCIVYTGASPVFADIDSRTYCIDPEQIKHKNTKKTKGIIPVHFAGQPCDIARIATVAKQNNLIVIEDAAHAIGANYKVDSRSYKVGSCAHSDMTTFSFHPVKHITTGEGGIITTNDYALYTRLRLLRTHGITRDRQALKRDDGPWYYEQQDLGFNYRITDLQCALGLSQLKRLDEFIMRRKKIAAEYNKAFEGVEDIRVPFQKKEADSSWHLYVLGFRETKRGNVFNALRKRGIGVNVHYIPVHMQPYYQEYFGYVAGDFPKAEEYYAGAITLPLYPAMTDNEVNYIIESILDLVRSGSK